MAVNWVRIRETRNKAVPETSPQRPWLAVGVVLLVATSFALNTACAAVAIEAGSTPLTMLTVRASGAAVAIFVFLVAAGHRARLPRGERRAALALGPLIVLYSYGLLAALEFIPLALAVLIFYTYPLITAVVAWLTGQERFSRRTAAALALAFAGLTIALDVAGEGADGRGVALAGFAAVALAALVLGSARLIRGGDSRPATLHMLAAAAATAIVACLVTGDFALPQTQAGWLGFLGAPVFYTMAFIGFFWAMAKAGPVRTSLTMNFEPVASMAFGFLLLGQTLSPLQILGAGLVIAAVLGASVRGASVRAGAAKG